MTQRRPLNLEVLRAGPGDGESDAAAGEPLVLLHGFTGDAGTWRAVSSALERERCVLAVDLPGHGRSSLTGVESVAAAALAVDAAVTGLLRGRGAGHQRSSARGEAASLTGRYHLAGYSLGGRVALRLALDLPARVRSLTLISCSAGFRDEQDRAEREAADQQLARRIESGRLDEFVDEWMTQPLFATLARLDPEVLAESRAQRLSSTPAGLAAALRGMGAGTMAPMWGELGVLDLPVLVTAGGLDEKYAALAHVMAGAIPGARLELIEGAGHALSMEAPDELAAVIDGFLGAVEDGANFGRPGQPL